MRLVPLAAPLCAASAVVLALAARPAAPAPAVPFGPGAVIEMHTQLLGALDRGDGEKAASLLVSGAENDDPVWNQPSLFLDDERGLPASATTLASAKELLAKRARASKDGGPEWSTKIVRQQADCRSEGVTGVVLELERSRGVKGGVFHYRSTSLVRWTKDGFRLVHWHVSPADEETARAIAAR